ncbi:virulence associated lipoprotein [Borreliella bavariensis]|uniref:virulence associated lipoprotein n=1 Tax=Borreliella bavariensis TaxID=664662 RepID=UPI001C0230E1|nr:virulence associated lipoprotein [Borreliella bavariensis]
MKYNNIIVSMLVFLFLTACNPDFNTNQKDVKHQSSKKRLKSNQKRLKSNQKGLKPKAEVTQNQEEVQNQEADQNKKTKNTLLDDLKKLIEEAKEDREKYVKKLQEEPLNQYEILAFNDLFWQDGSGENASQNTERSKEYRRNVYGALNAIDTNKLKDLSVILRLSKQSQGILNALNSLGGSLDETIVCLSSKKDTLDDELDISNLEKLKNSFEKLLSTRTVVSEMINQLLLDYQYGKDSIQTNNTKLESYANELFIKIEAKSNEAYDLKNSILYNPIIT